MTESNGWKDGETFDTEYELHLPDEEGYPLDFEDEMESNQYTEEEIVQMIHTDLSDDPLYIRMKQLRLLNKLTEPEFIKVVNPHKSYSLQEACYILGNQKKPTLYMWVRDLENVHAIEVIEKSDVKPLTWKGLVQIKMFYILKTDGNEANRDIINFIKSRRAVDISSGEDVAGIHDEMKRIKHELGRYQFMTAALFKMVAGVDTEPAKLLESPEKVLEVANMHAEAQRQKAKDFDGLHQTLGIQENTLKELNETIERIHVASEEEKRAMDELYAQKMEDLKKHFDGQMEEIIKNQKKGFFEKLFGR